MINLYLHSGSENHGCEAIVRSTVNMLEQRVNLFSMSPSQDYKYGIDKLCAIKADDEERLVPKSKEWFLARIQTKITHEIDLEIKYRRKALFENVNKNDICLSIGGDNYCYQGTQILASINKNLKKKGTKLVLWGCSVEPDLISKKEIAYDLKKFDLITARETISYNALKKINRNTVLVSDPAFTLQREDLPLPSGLQENNIIGINISPLILNLTSNKEIVLKAYTNLIAFILNNTVYSIALIPHVVWKNNDDRIVLNEFYKTYKNSNRVVMIDDCNCMQLKGYIARCRIFIGARTHATIAAYSTYVPTLVIGYSVKATGIARDIFRSEENYVLPVQDIVDEHILIDRFCWLENNYEKIKQHLILFMPEYINKAYDWKKYFDRLIEI